MLDKLLVISLLALLCSVVLYAYARWRDFRSDRDIKRAREGLCLKCGYDMRARPFHCTECGFVHDAKKTILLGDGPTSKENNRLFSILDDDT